MIICSCNNISDTSILKPFKTICGRCKNMEKELSNITILKSYKNYSLLCKEGSSGTEYSIYCGYLIFKIFNDYTSARNCFDDIKNNKENS